MIAKFAKFSAYIARKHPDRVEGFTHFSNIYGFAQSNRHLLRGFLNVIDEFRITVQKESYLTEEEFQLLDGILLEMELAIALETSGAN